MKDVSPCANKIHISQGPGQDDLAVNPRSSRIAGFAKMSTKHRIQNLLQKGLLSSADANALLHPGALPVEQADRFIENCVGTFPLPLGIATNFVVDGEEVFVPMAVEESSVVAAASYGAKLARSGGGFFSIAPQTITTCQIQFCAAPHVHVAQIFHENLKELLIQKASACCPRLVARGGGVTGVDLRLLDKPGYYVLHIHVDTREAMGANVVNSMAEEIGAWLPTMLECQVGPKILTNLALHRLVKVWCEITFDALQRPGFSGEEVAQRICQVWEFADLDIFRTTTHNKGVMNGIDPVVIATGNDWRAVNAGCHAYAALSGKYKPFTRWFINQHGRLQGEIELPIAVGTVGGVTRLHPCAAACLRIMGNPPSARLATIIASVGLAQNLSAIRALGCEGLQRGHMALHEKNLEMMRFYDHLPPLSVIGPGSAPAVDA